MYEIFGIEMSIEWYITLFVICQFINVALNTAKTIIMHKEEKVSSSVINAITYGFYAIIVVMTASALPLWITIIITILTNLIGVYGSMWVLERFKKDSLWEIVATVQGDFPMIRWKEMRYTVNDFLEEHLQGIPFNRIATSEPHEYVYHIYSENQEQSKKIKELLNKVHAKYIVHEERVKL